LKQGKIENLERALKGWQEDHTDAMRVFDLEDLVQEVLSMRGDLPSLWQRIWESAIADEMEDFQTLGLALRELFERCLRNMSAIRTIAQAVSQETGQTIGGVGDLQLAIAELQQLQQRVFANWPWTDRPWPSLDRAMVAESRASSARGEGEDIDQALARVQVGQPLVKE